MSRRFNLLIYLGLWLSATCSWGQDKFTTEEHFHDLFITAGYSTAFGAALGAAALGLTDNPVRNMRWVAVGASLGFITGSLLGTYIMFAPAISYNYVPISANPPALFQGRTGRQPPRLVIQPVWQSSTHKIAAVQAQWNIASF